MTVPTIS